MSFKLKDINKNRAAMMGVAAILVMLVHLLGATTDNFWITNIHSLCQNSVDIFLLLSGIGCYYAVNKHSLKDFYVRRLSRVLIPYLIVFVAYGLVNLYWGDTVLDYIQNHFFTSFFTQGIVVGWYVSAILVLYAVTPLLNLVLKKSNAAYAILTGAVLIAVCQIGYTQMSDAFYNVHELFLNRIPIYMIGLAVGKYISTREEEEATVNVYSIAFVIVLYFVAFTCNNYYNTTNRMDIMRYLALLAVPLGVVLMTLFFNKFECKELAVIGGASLETYLINEKLTQIMSIHTALDNYLINLFGFVFTIILAILLRRVVSYGTNKVPSLRT